MLSHPDIRRVVITRLVSRSGTEASFFVGIWGKTAYDLGAGPADLALLLFVVGVTRLAAAGLAGMAVDRFDPKRVLLVGEVVFIPSILLLVLADSLTVLTLLAPFPFIAGTFIDTAVASLPPFLVTNAGELEKANASVEGAGTLGFVIGPAVGAVIARLFSVDGVFVFDAVTSLMVLPLILAVHPRAAAVDEDPQAALTGMAKLRAGFRYAYARPAVRLPLLLGTLTWVGFGVFGTLEPLFYRDVLQTGPEALGLVNSLFGAGLFVGSVLYGRSGGRLRSARAATLLTAGCGLGAVAYVGTGRLAGVLVGAVLWSVPLGVLFPLLRTLIQLHTEEAYVGRVMGALSAHHTAGEMVPLAFAPALATAFGVQGVLVAAGLLVTVVAPLFLGAAHRADDRAEDLLPAGFGDGIPDAGVTPAILTDLEEPATPH